MSAWDVVTDPVVLSGLPQLAAALALSAVALVLVHRQGLRLTRELSGALARGLVQILAIGSVLALVLTAPVAASAPLLAFMVTAAAWLSRKRAAGVPGAFRVSLTALAVGSGSVIVVMTLAGGIEPEVRALVPVGSVIIASAMRANSLALDRLKSDVSAHRARVEAVLALGGSPAQAMEANRVASARAALIPVVDSLRSLGLVWIPGLMAGMVLAGANPVYAAEYQFVLMAMVFAASTLTVVVGTRLIARAFFNAAEQLVVGEEGSAGGRRLDDS